MGIFVYFFRLILKTRRSRGYCFIYFESMKSAVRAVESSHHLRIDNRFVRVDYSITSRPRSPGSYERYKDEMRHHNGLRHRSHRRHSPSPRREYRVAIKQHFLSLFDIGLKSFHWKFCFSFAIRLLSLIDEPNSTNKPLRIYQISNHFEFIECQTHSTQQNRTKTKSKQKTNRI